MSSIFTTCIDEDRMTEAYHQNKIPRSKHPFYPRYNKVMPFQIEYFHRLFNTNFREVRSHLPKDIVWIHLKRKDNFARLTSYFFAGEHHLCRIYSNKKVLKDTQVTYPSVVRFLKHQQKANPEGYWDRIIKKHNLKVQEIYYEDFLEDPNLLTDLVVKCGYNKKVATRSYYESRMKIVRRVYDDEYIKIGKMIRKAYMNGDVER